MSNRFSNALDRTVEIDYTGLIQDDRVAAQLYVDQDVFNDEMEQFYHRGWVFVGHTSEVAQPGEFVTRQLGLQPILMTRDPDNNLRLFANRCPHRGSTVCVQESGQAKHFRCPYHGWTFDTTGSLVGLPHADGYGPDFERDTYGLAPVPRMDSYRGLVFGSWAAEGPSLLEHLGNATGMIDQLCDLSPLGELEIRSGWLKHSVQANWKMIAENVCDFYHPARTHASSLLPSSFFRDDTGVINRYLGGGHAEVDSRPAQQERPLRSLDTFEGAELEWLQQLAKRDGTEGAIKRIRGGTPHGLIFPNLFIADQNFFVMHPTHAGKTHHVQTPVFYAGAPEAINRRQLRRFEGASGPAGMLEPDDSAVWERLQRGLHAGQPEWVLLQRGFHRERAAENGMREGCMLDETALRGFWHHYKTLMNQRPASA